MALNFVAGSSQYLTSSTMPVTTTPFFVGGWCRFSSLGTQAIFSLSTSGSGDNRFSIEKQNVVETIRINARSTSSGTADSASAVTLNTWEMWGAFFESSTSRYAYLNGVAGTQNTTNRTPSAPNLCEIARRDTTTANFPDADFAEFGIWNATTKAGADEIAAMLADGISPICIRPDRLIAWWPLWGRYSSAIDPRGGNNLTLTNSPTYTDHPRIIYPSRPKQIYIPSAAPPAGTKRKRMMLLGVGS